MKTKIFAERQLFNDSIALHMRSDRPWMAGAVAMPLCFTVPVQGMITYPFVTLAIDEAQALMDELWHVGLRPSEGSGSAGSLAATERHLADMKTLAFHALKVKP